MTISFKQFLVETGFSPIARYKKMLKTRHKRHTTSEPAVKKIEKQDVDKSNLTREDNNEIQDIPNK